MSERPTLREVFFSKEKQPQVFFYTSSVAKYLHARVVFEKSGLILHEFKSRHEPYSEDYALGKDALLDRAISEILSSVGTGSFFFVEDTSLRLEALSTGQNDVPGLRVKEWFAEAEFEQIDATLRARGNDRRAAVKSDIALHIPGLGRPLIFHGETAGTVAEQLPQFEENAQFPWLTPHSFNGWFVPEGCTRVLGEMSLEESWQHDFRTRALELVLARLEEYTAVLNVPSSAYLKKESPVGVDQLSLLPPPEDHKVFVVVGHTCAGKTTFGEYAHSSHNYVFLEASSVLRMIAKNQRVSASDPFSLATTILDRYGSDVVARKILELYAGVERGLVITGFRTMEELELIKKRIPHAKVVFVEAGARTRYQRHLDRGRYETVRTFEDFQRHDSQQWSLGLLRVAEDFADIRVVNESTLDDYRKRVGALLQGKDLHGLAGISTKVQPRHEPDENQLFKCLLALREAGRPLSCDEIEEISRASGNPVRHNNANKVLKRVPELARRLELEGTRVRYDITNAGRTYLRYMQSRQNSVQASAMPLPTRADR